MPANASDKDIRFRLARCEREIDTLRQTGKDLRRRLAESESRFLAILTEMPHPILIHRDDTIVFINPAALQTLGGGSAGALIGQPLSTCVTADTHRTVAGLAHDLLAGRRPPQTRSGTFQRLDGTLIKVEWIASVVAFDGRPALLMVFADITGRRRMENTLRTNQEELAQQSLRLEETNRALKLMLDHRQIEKRAIEANLMAGMKKFVLPYLDKVAAGSLTPEVRTYLDILRSNLDDLLSPMRHQRFVRYADLTPNEVQIAELIRQGRSSKEIAIQLNVSASAIAFHRNNIRRKFGLLKKGTNLRAYLDSLGA